MNLERQKRLELGTLSKVIGKDNNDYEEAKAVYELKHNGMSRRERRAQERRLAKLKRRHK